MKVILHDLGEEIAIPLGKKDKDSVVIHANNQYAPCRGCFQCWLKNPGFCIRRILCSILERSLARAIH